jgi:Protein of unknown function (DUF1194)
VAGDLPIGAAFAVFLAAAQPAPADLELVLAVDVSRSMDRNESALQRLGYVEAIRSADFAAAVAAGVHGRIRIAYVEWAGDGAQKIVVPWREIAGRDDAASFADALAAEPVAVFQRGTSISSALLFSAGMFGAEGGATRRVIDISGDGPNNEGIPAPVARDAVLASGIAINGLPVLIDPSRVSPALDRYYAACVIGGEGAFSLPVRGKADFADSILRKLLREVLSAGDGYGTALAAADTPVDCLAGERERARRTDRYYPELDR